MFQVRTRRRQLTVVHQLACQIEQRIVIGWVDLDRAPPAVDRGIPLSLAELDRAKTRVRSRRSRIDCEGPLECSACGGEITALHLDRCDVLIRQRVLRIDPDYRPKAVERSRGLVEVPVGDAECI